MALLLLLVIAAWMQRKFQIHHLITGGLLLYLFLFIIATFSGGMHIPETVSYDQSGVGFTPYAESIGIGPGLYLFIGSVVLTGISFFLERKVGRNGALVAENRNKDESGGSYRQPFTHP